MYYICQLTPTETKRNEHMENKGRFTKCSYLKNIALLFFDPERQIKVVKLILSPAKLSWLQFGSRGHCCYRPGPPSCQWGGFCTWAASDAVGKEAGLNVRANQVRFLIKAKDLKKKDFDLAVYCFLSKVFFRIIKKKLEDISLQFLFPNVALKIMCFNIKFWVFLVSFNQCVPALDLAEKEF